MISFMNPYTPGAGTMPRYLAGRERVLTDAMRRLQAIAAGYQARSVVYFGLRGVGKTVILNAIEQQGEDLGALVKYIEVEEQKGMVRALSSACNSFVLALNRDASRKAKWQKAVAILKSFTLKWNPADNSLELGMEEDIPRSAAASSGDLSSDLTELLVALGGYASESKVAICFCLDELQYAREEELEALITALHRCNQLGLPVVMFCAGLPIIRKTLGDSKSYGEHLFEFIEIDSLQPEAAVRAIAEPAEPLGVSYTPDAIKMIVDYTQGYPYFIQELCSTIWEKCPEGTKSIDANDVDSAVADTNARLDAGFFSVRFDRCTPREKEFLAAMVACGKLPCSLDCVARKMKLKKQSIGPFRAHLINKGLIYATGRNEVDFTVPQFDRFITRQNTAANAS